MPSSGAPSLFTKALQLFMQPCRISLLSPHLRGQSRLLYSQQRCKLILWGIQLCAKSEEFLQVLTAGCHLSLMVDRFVLYRPVSSGWSLAICHHELRLAMCHHELSSRIFLLSQQDVFDKIDTNP